MSVRIQRIIVEKLFGKFNYDLNLANGYDVSILIGPNGCGKTTIFNFIYFIFNLTYDSYLKIKDIPFNEFKCILSSGKSLRLFRAESINKSPNPNGKEYDLFFDDGNGINIKIDEYLTSFIQDQRINNCSNDFIDFIDFKRNIREKARGHRYFSSRLPIDSAKDDVEQDFFTLIYNNLNNLDEKYYYSLLDSVNNIFKILNDDEYIANINYITSNRLYDVKKDNEVVESLSKIKNEIINIFNEANDKYKKRLSKAKDVILREYLNVDDNNPKIKDQDSFIQFWKDYMTDLTNYSKIGLIDRENDVLDCFKEKNGLANVFRSKPAFMIVYIEAFKDTLKPFKDFYNKFYLFQKILNERNEASGKAFAFSREKGIVFSVDGNDLPLECMSSGEKNDFIMFYNLIFNSHKGGVVLVDEPEISLHIEWQDAVIDTMFDICEMNKLQVIIATHSPHIVNGYNDLILKGGPTK